MKVPPCRRANSDVLPVSRAPRRTIFMLKSTPRPNYAGGGEEGRRGERAVGRRHAAGGGSGATLRCRSPTVLLLAGDAPPLDEDGPPLACPAAPGCPGRPCSLPIKRNLKELYFHLLLRKKIDHSLTQSQIRESELVHIATLFIQTLQRTHKDIYLRTFASTKSLGIASDALASFYDCLDDRCRLYGFSPRICGQEHLRNCRYGCWRWHTLLQRRQYPRNVRWVRWNVFFSLSFSKILLNFAPNSLEQPYTVAMAPGAQAFYISERSGSRVRRVDSASGLITTVLASGTVISPTGLAVRGTSAEHELFFADQTLRSIHVWNRNSLAIGSVVTTSSGSLVSPQSLALHPLNQTTLYVADGGSHKVAEKAGEEGGRLIGFVADLCCEHRQRDTSNNRGDRSIWLRY